MKRMKWRTAAGGLMLGGLIGCAHDGIVKVENAERAATVWGSPSDASRAQGGVAPHVCLEYSTPAQELAASKSSLSVPINGQSVALSHESAENLATIYSVSEIMQFGHAALYRLCEAAGNGAIPSEHDYYKLFAVTLEQVHGLIRLQLEKDSVSALTLLDRWRSDIEGLDRRRCRLREAEATETRASDRELKEKREQLARRYNDLLAAQKLDGMSAFELPAGAMPDFADYAFVRRYEALPEKQRTKYQQGYEERKRKIAGSICTAGEVEVASETMPELPPEKLPPVAPKLPPKPAVAAASAPARAR